MKLVQHVLAISALTAVSISIFIPTWSRQHSHDPDGISPVESSAKAQWLAVGTSSDAKDTAFWKYKALVKRAKDGEIADVSDEPSDVDLGAGSGQPTTQEAEEVLSTEEFDQYIEAWNGFKAYNRAFYAAKRAEREGRELTSEVIEQLKTYRPDVTAYRALVRVVQNRLLESGKARPAIVKAVETRRARRKERDQAKQKKIAALEARIKTGKATEQDHKDWEAVKAERRRKNQAQNARAAKRRGTQDAESIESELARKRAWANANYQAKKNRKEALRARIRSEQATEEERKEWEDLEAKRRAKYKREREWLARKIIEKAKASSEDGSNPSRDTSSNEIRSGGVGRSNHNPLPLIPGNPLSKGARHLIGNLRDNWQTIPWSSYWPPYTRDRSHDGLLASPWSTNRPLYAPPLIRGIP